MFKQLEFHLFGMSTPFGSERTACSVLFEFKFADAPALTLPVERVRKRDTLKCLIDDSVDKTFTVVAPVVYLKAWVENVRLPQLGTSASQRSDANATQNACNTFKVS